MNTRSLTLCMGIMMDSERTERPRSPQLFEPVKKIFTCHVWVEYLYTSILECWMCYDPRHGGHLRLYPPSFRDVWLRAWLRAYEQGPLNFNAEFLEALCLVHLQVPVPSEMIQYLKVTSSSLISSSVHLRL